MESYHEQKFREELETWHPVAKSMGYLALREHDTLSMETFMAVVDLVTLNQELIKIENGRDLRQYTQGQMQLTEYHSDDPRRWDVT
jgi:hypothetical protein